MPLSYKNLETLTEADIQTLVLNAVREGRRIEYKLTLPGNTDEDKREFLADVSSFANASGGDLLYGVTEEGGLPTSVPGVHLGDVNAVVLRLESIIRDGIEPRLPNIRTYPVKLDSGTFVLIVRVPQSWALPHMVTFKNWSRFFSRTSAGKCQLDVSELRNLFARAGDAADRVRRFRDERLARIVAGEGALPLRGSTLTILHLVPLRLFDPSTYHDLQKIEGTEDLRTVMFGGGEIRWNVDGYATFGDREMEGTRVGSYVQLFRHGAIEAVDVNMLTPRPPAGAIIPGGLAQELAQAIPRFLRAQQRIGVELPIAVLITLLGVKGHRLAVGTHGADYGPGHPVDHDLVQAADVIVEDWNMRIGTALRPALDTIWNAAGWSQCSFYNEAGELQLPY